MSRAIRRVPTNWEHPQFYRENYYPGEGYQTKLVYKPLLQSDYKEAVGDYKKSLKNWLRGQKKWNEGIYWNEYDGTEKPKKVKFKEWLDSIEEDRNRHGFKEDYRSDEKRKYITGICTWQDVAGDIPSMPDPDDYMPTGKWYHLFEEVSEGTPITPPFKTKQELVDYLIANGDFWGHKWTKEQAEAMVKKEWAPSMVVINGKVYSSEESLTI